MTLTLPDTTKYEINTVTQFTDEEKQAQGRAMLDEEKAEFDLLVKKVKGDIARLGGARVCYRPGSISRSRLHYYYWFYRSSPTSLFTGLQRLRYLSLLLLVTPSGR
jgi:hypothetical protein